MSLEQETIERRAGSIEWSKAPDSPEPRILEDIKPWLKWRDSFSYAKPCSCGMVHRIKTQRDDCPEYYTDIYIQCPCGKDVHFSLPVN